jgi:hypothetical protein
MTSQKEINCREIHEQLKEEWKKTGLDITDICDHKDEEEANVFQGKWDMLNSISAKLGQGVFTAFELEIEEECNADCENCAWGCGIDDPRGEDS